MESAFEKFEIHDLFVVIIPGIISILCTIYLYPQLYDALVDTFKDNIVKYAIFFGFSYVFGTALHEIGSVFEKKLIYRNGEPQDLMLLKKSNVVPNDMERILFKEVLTNILDKLGVKHDEELSKIQIRMAFNYCQCELERKGANKKPDKMQSIYGMSRSFLIYFIGASVVYFCNVFIWQYIPVCEEVILKFVLLIALTATSYRRMCRYAMLRVRNIMRAYVTCKKLA